VLLSQIGGREGRYITTSGLAELSAGVDPFLSASEPIVEADNVFFIFNLRIILSIKCHELAPKKKGATTVEVGQIKFTCICIRAQNKRFLTVFFWEVL